MKIIFWGTPEYSVISLENLLNSNHEILAVVTQPDKRRSRGKKLIPSPVKVFSQKNSIPTLCPEKIKNNSDFISTLKEFNPDIFIVVAYGKILTKEILEIPKYHCWNAHASLLPRWRGAAPIQWSLLSGDKYTGVNIMKMNEGLDTGDILLEEKIEIEDEENYQTLSVKLSILSSKLLINALEILSKHKISEISLTQQININRDIKYARMITKEDYLLDLNNSALNISRKVKALYPKTYIRFKEKNLKILKIRIINDHKIIKNSIYSLKENEIGVVVDIFKNEGIVITTKTKPIILLEVKLEGKNIASGNKLSQQLNPEIGDYFC